VRRALGLACLFAALWGHLSASSVRAGKAVCFITGYVGTGYRTATGVWPQVHHTVAVDPAFIPYGAHVRIAGLPWTLRAEDTGALGWGHLDVFMSSVGEAYALTSYRACHWW
jgi:3D (Asp-Asp-Asp) domain-containing protein